ncbi:hypothetical protein PSP6_460013 [Paraburkholderia tropica]|uniref:hypothetical protein n=1 Tax=Paraburkholderia tropica TaxID=92647 RepID=UPI001CB41800|nr:hypothetical protein [Paraburkholderia tropica]CAG9223690.1 hypothetical protein PSP6_460013 [Paraburkholderia tropica]
MSALPRGICSSDYKTNIRATAGDAYRTPGLNHQEMVGGAQNQPNLRPYLYQAPRL